MLKNQHIARQTGIMKTLTMMAAIMTTSGVMGVSPQLRARVDQGVEKRADLRELLASARGVAASVCALAADGATNGWGGSWDAPDVAVRADVRQLVRNMRVASLDRAETQALLDALGSDDNCVRHMAGTLIGRSGDRAFVPELTQRLQAQAPY